MTSAPLDLLHERRRALGHPDPDEEASFRRALVLKGAFIGAALLAASGIVTAALMLRQQVLQGELDRLALVEAEVQAAESRLGAARQSLGKVKRANQALVQGLLNVRSGSALMRDLQGRVPQGVQLTSVDVSPSGTSLRLSGTAADPMAFARINAFQIELGRSTLLVPSSVVLVKAARGGAEVSQPGPTALLVQFEFKAQFRPPLPPLAELQILRELGAQGLVQRFERLKAEGLL